MEPINYLAQVADPFAQALQGVKIGAGLADLEAQRALQVRQQQQQQLALQEQAKFFSNPNPTMRDAAKYASLLTPDQSKAFLPFMEGISKEQQQNTLKTTGQLLAALQTNPQVFITKAKENALAASNSGDMEDSTFFEQMAEAAADPERGPAVVFKSLAVRTAGIPGAKEFFENIDKSLSTARAEAKGPSELAESEAKAKQAITEAQTKVADLRIKLQNEPIEAERLIIKRDLEIAQADVAKVNAEFARTKAEAEGKQAAATLRKTDADILIAKEDNRIKALTVAQAKETNVLRQKELQQKIDDAKEKRDSAERDQKATVSNQSADIDNFLNTATRILQTPKDVIASATGPVASRLPTLSADVADFEALVEALGSQAFIAQIPKIKGTGSLSEKEGDKLQASLQTLSLKQSPARLEENVKEAVRLLTKVRENIAVKYGVQAPPLDVPAGQLNVTVGGVTYNFPTKAAADAFKNSDAYRRAAGTR